MSNNKNNLKGTKAETLVLLEKSGFPVPKVFYFTVKKWIDDKECLLTTIQKKFFNYKYIVIRSSSLIEDSSDFSMAGSFDSILNVDIKNKSKISKSIDKVIKSFDKNIYNQVLVQPMIRNVAISGVIMTKVLDDGSPYYVINFDDSTGSTNSVTSGNSINKTVYVYNGFKNKDFESKYLLKVLKMIKKLEAYFNAIPLDIEFAINKKQQIYLFQVRAITTSAKWNKKANMLVSKRLPYLEKFIFQLMKRRTNLYGKKTLLGIMSDWNPAEMIGVVPRPLAMSLYRELITKRVWRHAREMMGYKKMPSVELMVSLFGRVYIDVRNSMNSFLPNDLSPIVSEKLINAYIDRLEKYPYLHDKIEFEIVQTAYDFKFKENIINRYPNLLNEQEFLEFKKCMIDLTENAILESKDNSLKIAFENIEKLKLIQKNKNFSRKYKNPYEISDNINLLINDCIRYGTTPFSIAARHGFIAESLLRSISELGIIDKRRILEFKQSVKTISTEMSIDFLNVCENNKTKEDFLEEYGHLRPSSYDILSPCYKNRKDLFDGESKQIAVHNKSFTLNSKEIKVINNLLKEHGFKKINANDIFNHAEKAIKGREYLKFIFTKHLSCILENMVEWGKMLDISIDDISMLSIDEVRSALFTPISDDLKSFFKIKIKKSKDEYSVASSLKLNYLIRSLKDIYIAPIQRSTPNFISDKRLEGELIFLKPHFKKNPILTNKIICIESADPGYDWIFSKNILGLITKYGGTNSHMAIRCAEYNLPAAIGCGEQPFEKIIKAKIVLLDCQGKRLEPLVIN